MNKTPADILKAEATITTNHETSKSYKAYHLDGGLFFKCGQS